MAFKLSRIIPQGKLRGFATDPRYQWSELLQQKTLKSHSKQRYIYSKQILKLRTWKVYEIKTKFAEMYISLTFTTFSFKILHFLPVIPLKLNNSRSKRKLPAPRPLCSSHPINRVFPLTPNVWRCPPFHSHTVDHDAFPTPRKAGLWPWIPSRWSMNGTPEWTGNPLFLKGTFYCSLEIYGKSQNKIYSGRVPTRFSFYKQMKSQVQWHLKN